jgi:hypothetical protein
MDEMDEQCDLSSLSADGSENLSSMEDENDIMDHDIPDEVLRSITCPLCSENIYYGSHSSNEVVSSLILML